MSTANDRADGLNANFMKAKQNKAAGVPTQQPTYTQPVQQPQTAMQGMMNGQGFQGQGYGQTQGLMGMPQTDVGMLINNLASGSGGSGNLDQFMSAAFQQPGTQQAMPQQPVDTGSVGYMNNQQQQQIAQQQGPTDFLAYANSVRPEAPPPVKQEDINKKNNQIISYMQGDGDTVRTTYGELDQRDKDEYDEFGYISYR